jgi:hypothetical protein
MSSIINAALQAASGQGADGLTFAEIVRDIPHDGAAFLIYALIAASCYVIWKANRGPSARS